MKSPHKSGKCISIHSISPKKPNSAQRKVARIFLSNLMQVWCYIPGSSVDHGLQKSSKILIRGGNTQDLPGLHYKIIRGKLDCRNVLARLTARSKYGTKRWQKNIKVRFRRKTKNDTSWN